VRNSLDIHMLDFHQIHRRLRYQRTISHRHQDASDITKAKIHWASAAGLAAGLVLAEGYVLAGEMGCEPVLARTVEAD
jgi:hypothetical protein